MSLAWESVPLASLCEAAQCSHWVVRRSVAEVSKPQVLTEGLQKAGGVEPRPYARLPKAHASYVRGDVGIAPYGMTTDSRA